LRPPPLDVPGGRVVARSRVFRYWHSSLWQVACTFSRCSVLSLCSPFVVFSQAVSWPPPSLFLFPERAAPSFSCFAQLPSTWPVPVPRVCTNLGIFARFLPFRAVQGVWRFGRFSLYHHQVSFIAAGLPYKCSERRLSRDCVCVCVSAYVSVCVSQRVK